MDLQNKIGTLGQWAIIKKIQEGGVFWSDVYQAIDTSKPIHDPNYRVGIIMCELSD